MRQKNLDFLQVKKPLVIGKIQIQGNQQKRRWVETIF